MFTASIITVSDKGFVGLREDLSGLTMKNILEDNDYKIASYTIVKDDVSDIVKALKEAVALNANLILTSGGTGFSKRDVTPEATNVVIEKNAPGIAEAIRANSMTYTPRAMLSRGVSGICGDSLIINLPGSPKAVTETLEFLLPSLQHGLDILSDKAHDCARK
ncbi:MAG: MogA/MoaB family molybdenum cofactor biosynthesis protein [Clostridia bacterium]